MSRPRLTRGRLRDGAPFIAHRHHPGRPLCRQDRRRTLAAAYPPDARAKGIEGKAVVKARITPDGQVRDLAVLSETAPGFGAACKATLRTSAWTPPLDRNGQAVSRVISCTCRFNVE